MGLDYYELLEINKGASDDDVKKAYRRLAPKYHPNRNNDRKAQEHFSGIAEAYDVLSTPTIKALYDQHGEEAIKKGINASHESNEKEGHLEKYTFHGDPMKVYRDFFGVDSPFAELYLSNLDPNCKFLPENPGTGPDFEQALPLSLEDAFYGTTKSIDVPLKVVDKSGTRAVDVVKNFTFRIPKGTTNGHCFYFKAAGTSGPNMSPGNVTFKAEVQPNDEFKLEGHDFFTIKTINLAEALLGCTVKVNTFDGKTIHVPITEVIKPKHRIYLKGEGMPILGFACKGDLIVEFDISFPEKLSDRQRELLKQAFAKKSKEK